MVNLCKMVKDMKRKQFVCVCWALVVPFLLFSVSCTDNENARPSVEFVLDDAVPGNWVLPANDTSVFVKFQAYNDWRVSVEQDSSEESLSSLDWLSLSEYSGKAGQHTLSMSISENTTDTTRNAKVIFYCGMKRVVVNVTQEEGQEENDSLQCRKGQISEIREQCYGEDPYSRSYKFGYDSIGRLVRVNWDGAYGVCILSYQQNSIQYSSQFGNVDGYVEYKENGTAQLDKKGNATSWRCLNEELCSSGGYYYREEKYACTMSYEDGYLQEHGNEDYHGTWNWQDGCPVTYNRRTSGIGNDYVRVAYSDIENKGSIDLNMFVGTTSEWLWFDGSGALDVVGWAGLLGRRSSYMPSKVENHGDADGCAYSRLFIYTYDTDEYGRIVKITEEDDDGDRVVYDITYSE